MVPPALWQYFVKSAEQKPILGQGGATLLLNELVSWTKHLEPLSIICTFITHLVETGILEEGYSSAVHVSPLANVWLRT